MVWLCYMVKKSLSTGLCSPVSTQYTNVTYHRRTDWQTDTARQHRPCLCRYRGKYSEKVLFHHL